MIQISVEELLFFIFIGAIMALLSVFAGAFIAHRSKTAEPGTSFLTGRAPKGEVFSIPTEGLEEEVPPEISARNKVFNAIFGGQNETNSMPKL